MDMVFKSTAIYQIGKSTNNLIFMASKAYKSTSLEINT